MRIAKIRCGRCRSLRSSDDRKIVELRSSDFGVKVGVGNLCKFPFCFGR
jgi:hypothetical protein